MKLVLNKGEHMTLSDQILNLCEGRTEDRLSKDPKAIALLKAYSKEPSKSNEKKVVDYIGNSVDVSDHTAKLIALDVMEILRLKLPEAHRIDGNNMLKKRTENRVK